MARTILIGGMLFAWSSILLAQQRPLIEEIIVTAQRVEESEQRVPISISAFPESMIEDRRIIGVADLQIFTPNLRYTTNDFSDVSVSIRGIGTRVAGNEAQAGVSMHINEIPLPNGTPPLELFDVERIEVLRGPQGTLYGRNATGGVINLITHKPDPGGFGGYVDVEFGDHDLRRLRGAINIPVTTDFTVRIAALSLDRDGYTTNLAGGQVPGVPNDVDGRDLHAFRLSGLWQPSDATEIWLAYERFDEDDDRMFTHQRVCRTFVTPINCEPDTFGLDPWGQVGITALNNGLLGITALGANDEATGLSFEFPRPEIDNLRQLHIDYSPVNEIEQEIIQFGLSHDFGTTQVSLNAGYHEWQWHIAYDGDWSAGYNLNPIGQNPSGVWPMSIVPDGVDGLTKDPCNINQGKAGFLGGCVWNDALMRSFSVSDRDEDMQHWSAEAKVRTEISDRITLLAGAIYENSEIRSLTTGTSNTIDILLSPGYLGTLPIYPSFGANPSEFEFESKSAFAEFYAQLTPRMALTVGARYNDDKQKIADAFILPGNAIDANMFFGGGEPRFVRDTLFQQYLLGIPQAGVQDLLALYGATDAVESASSPDELVSALQLVPPVPQLNEARQINGSPTRRKWNAWSGRVVLDWRVAEDLLAYASYSRGYKPGGFNSNDSSTLFTYDREDVDGFEVGFKSLLFESSLSFNVALFFYQHGDLQIADEEEDTLVPGTVNTNIDAQLYGAELNLRWRPAPLPQLEFEVGYARVEAEVDSPERQLDPNNLFQGDTSLVVLFDFENANQAYVVRTEEVRGLVEQAIQANKAIGPDVAPGAQYPNGIPTWISQGYLAENGVFPVGPEALAPFRVNLEGNRLAETPTQTLHLAASYTWSLRVGYLTARWDYYWQDDFYTSVFNRRSSKVRSWGQHNAALVYESPNGKWDIRAWIHNIEDDVNVSGGQRTEDLQIAVTEPRSYGASFRYSFGDR